MIVRLDDERPDAADEQGLPHELSDLPDEDDTDCGPSDDDLAEFDLAA